MKRDRGKIYVQGILPERTRPQSVEGRDEPLGDRATCLCEKAKAAGQGDPLGEPSKLSADYDEKPLPEAMDGTYAVLNVPSPRLTAVPARSKVAIIKCLNC